jgi:aromatic-L-amino-acid/L-tryptophan decarboxylase
VLEWLAELTGVPRNFFGVVYDTASVGVVHALAAARERVAPDIRGLGIAGRSDVGTLRVYASDQAHSSLDKAMIMLGLGERNVVRVESDDAFRMNVAALRDAMQRDAESGMRPFAVVATVGTTSTAAVDPVREIAAVCGEHDAWLHVDGAYGAAMAALPEGRWVLDGIELADSLVVNPHKWLFVPLDYSVLYTRHPQLLRAVFSLVPEYLRGDAGGSTIDYMDYGIQLGRRFRSLKAWIVFRALGQEGIRRRLRQHLAFAQEVAQWVEQDAAFELAAPVTMGVVAFRFTGAGDGTSSDRANEAIVEQVNASGMAYVTHTRLRGRVAIRIGFGNIATTEGDIRATWESIREIARRVDGTRGVE